MSSSSSFRVYIVMLLRVRKVKWRNEIDESEQFEAKSRDEESINIWNAY